MKEELPKLHVDTEPEGVERKHFSRKQKTILALAGVGLALAAAGFGCSGVGANKGEAPKVETPITAATKNKPSMETSTPAKAETKPEKVPAIEELQISAKLPPEQIAKEIITRLNALYTVGLKQEVYDEYNKQFYSGHGLGATEWSKQYTQPYVENYFAALFGENYKTNTDVAEFYQQSADVAAGNLDRYLRTDTETGDGNYGAEVFKYNMALEKINVAGPLDANVEGVPYVLTVNQTNNNSKTHLAETGWNDPSRDTHDVLRFTVKTEKNKSGADVILIKDASVNALNENQ